MPPRWEDVYQSSTPEAEIPVELDDRPARAEEGLTAKEENLTAVLLLRSSELRRRLLWLTLGASTITGVLAATLFVFALPGGGRGYGVLVGGICMGTALSVFAILHRTSRVIARTLGARLARRLARQHSVSEEALMTALQILE